MADVFNTLNAVNVNDHTEKKKTGNVELTYLSWAYAWAEVKKLYPEAKYEIEKFNGLPYVYDTLTGYMVYTTVTIEGVTHEMWLPVMDGANKAMKSEPYEYTTGYGQYQKTKVCEAATMFDINKTIMRCLVKNLAMFGLGLYIYAGEDLPEDDPDQAPKKLEPKSKRGVVSDKKLGEEFAVEIAATFIENGIDPKFVCQLYGIKTIAEMTEKQMDNAMKNLDKIKAKQGEQHE